MSESANKEDLPPAKKMRTEEGNGHLDDSFDHGTSGTNKSHQFTSFEGFEVAQILNNNEVNGSLAFQAKLKGKEGTAVVVLQKLPFNAEKLPDILTNETKLQDLFENDVYHNKKALLSPELNEVKATIVYPAEEKHILRFEKQESSFVNETPELYREVTKPFIESSSFSKQWIYNILEHKQEVDRIVYEDKDPENGFILVPDLKWTGEQVENLYLQAIIHRRDITCIRDLRACHIPLLKNVLNKGMAAIEEKYGIPSHKQRVFLHYQPSYYHLHFHFTALSFDAPGTWAGKAHLLSSVISNLEVCEDYYQKATLPFTVKDNHPLRLKFEEKGIFSK
ncbi:m7GpppX diphosphatase [Macrobrachium rosenbergii]|uniref:m7GpppX diphosphatase n=1 Tax=Macrobrachium rosenbergii TaxID=79674 RepID=UPI0034D5B70D